MMQIREYSKERDYAMLESWWVMHDWEPIHPSLLRPLAYICEIDGEPIGFAVLWPILNCGTAILEWIVTKPKAKTTHVILAIRKLTEFYVSWCRDNDYGVILTTCAQKGLARLHERNGFTRTDGEMIHLAMLVGD